MQSRIKFCVYMKLDPIRDRESKIEGGPGGEVNKCWDQRRPTNASCDQELVIDKY